MSTDLVAGGAAFGEVDGTGTGASFHWHTDLSTDGAGTLALTTWDGQFATGAFLDDPGVGYVSDSKVRTLDTTSLASGTPAASISTNSEQWFGGDSVFRQGFRTYPQAIGEGPAGSWLVGLYRGNAGFQGLTAGEWASLPSRGGNHYPAVIWELVDKSSGATTEALVFEYSPFGYEYKPRSVVVLPSGDIYGFTNNPALVAHFDSSGSYVGDVDMTGAMATAAAAAGCTADGEIMSATGEGGDIWFVTGAEFGGPSRLWRMNGGPTGTSDVILLDAADPGTNPRMPGGTAESVAVNATHIFVLVAGALWRYDRATLTRALIAGAGGSDPGDPPSMVVDGAFLWIAVTTTVTTQILRVPVNQSRKGWAVGYITMTDPP